MTERSRKIPDDRIEGHELIEGGLIPSDRRPDGLPPSHIQRDQRTYIQLRAKGHGEKYISENWRELGLSKKYSRDVLRNWRKKFRDEMRVAVKEEILELASELQVGTYNRVAGFAWIMQSCMDEMKKRAENDAFSGMSMKELIQEFRATARAVGWTLQPFETAVEKAEQGNVYMAFFNKVSIPDETDQEPVDARWVRVEEGGQEPGL